MVKKPLTVLWDIEAHSFFKKAITYIKKDSELNAQKVKKAILQSTSDLKLTPEKHAPDQYRVNNNGNYRAYEIYGYRIAYFISNDCIRIVRIRHTRMEPKSY